MTTVIYLEKVKLFQIAELLVIAATGITLNSVDPLEKNQRSEEEGIW